MRKRMEITTVLPVYNGAECIARTIEAVLAQSKPPGEIIVVDDCSTDDSRCIAERYGDKVTVLSIGRNSGVQIARNLGIAHARTDWVALCDHDNVWSQGYLARLSDLLDSEPGIEFAFCNFRTVRDGELLEGTKFDQAPEDYSAIRRTPDRVAWMGLRKKFRRPDVPVASDIPVCQLFQQTASRKGRSL